MGLSSPVPECDVAPLAGAEEASGGHHRSPKASGAPSAGTEGIPRCHPCELWKGTSLQVQFLLYSMCPGRGGYLSSRVFGYLISSARTRITSAVTNRQSTAIVIATRIQDDLLSNRPHLSCVGTARGSLSTACGPTAHSSEPIFHRRSHTRKGNSISLLGRGPPIDGIRHSCSCAKKTATIPAGFFPRIAATVCP